MDSDNSDTIDKFSDLEKIKEDSEYSDDLEKSSVDELKDKVEEESVEEHKEQNPEENKTDEKTEYRKE